MRAPLDARPYASGARPWPFAVAVVAVPAGASEGERREARLDVVLFAYKVGYFVLDVVEVPGDGAYRWAELLACRSDADAFVVAGAVDLPRLRAIADRVRMVVREAWLDGCPGPPGVEREGLRDG